MADREPLILKPEKREIGQNRAPNTIELRKKYNDYVIEQQSAGKDVDKFEDWVRKNHPDKKILVQ